MRAIRCSGSRAQMQASPSPPGLASILDGSGHSQRADPWKPVEWRSIGALSECLTV
jgi:hypothetical protein